ncbi:hypothetical protein [Tatumella sp. UBA2305]|uniref:hypothetical protein n=1 Tax=Tatumella sp. UBA2305 TaxID=1947647 RepID=UPI0025F7FC96|nr:hypothetical protein [Tatumella sp. UBA2305]
MKKLITLLLLSFTTATSFSAAAQWPPETGAKVPGNALEYPTRLSPVNQSLEQMLNQGGEIIASSLASDGPVVTLRLKKHYIFCLLKGAGSGSDQNVATSKCYAMN